MTTTERTARGGNGTSALTAEEAAEFYANLAARTSASSGLGLSIARRLARAMGGDVVYERADPGSRFVVTLAGAARGANAARVVTAGVS